MKKRKIAALLLSFTMFASAVPSMAQTTQDTDTVTSPSETQNEQLSQDIKTAHLERIKEYKSRFLSAKQLETDEENQDLSLMAASSNVTLSGTISLPSAVQQDAEIDVELYKLEKSGNKITNITTSNVAYDYVTIKKGKTSATYSISVPKGDYALSFTCYSPNAGVLNTTEYYAADGNVRTLELADSISLTSNKTQNITLSKAERTISGTVTLDKAAEEDGYVDISVFNSNYTVYGWTSANVSKGQSSVSYSIGVPAGIYELSSYSNDTESYYSITGDLSEDYNEACYLDVTEKSLSSINFTGGYEPYEKSQTIPVTLTVSNIVSYDRTYAVYFNQEDESSSGRITIKSGSKTGSVNIVSLYSEFSVKIADITDSPRSYDEYRYYYSSELGLTSNEDDADIFSSDTTKINLDLSGCFTLTGTVSRNGQKSGDALEVYVYADFNAESYDEDDDDDTYDDDDAYDDDNEDEPFYDIVTIPYNNDSAEYSILIPNYLDGENCDVYAKIRNMSNSAGEAKTITIGESDTANVSVTSDLFTVISGTVTLTQTAPKGGAALEIYSSGSYTRYYIAEGRRHNANQL
jgi:hypothetical protein